MSVRDAFSRLGESHVLIRLMRDVVTTTSTSRSDRPHPRGGRGSAPRGLPGALRRPRGQRFMRQFYRRCQARLHGPEALDLIIGGTRPERHRCSRRSWATRVRPRGGRRGPAGWRCSRAPARHPVPRCGPRALHRKDSADRFSFKDAGTWRGCIRSNSGCSTTRAHPNATLAETLGERKRAGGGQRVGLKGDGAMPGRASPSFRDRRVPRDPRGSDGSASSASLTPSLATASAPRATARRAGRTDRHPREQRRPLPRQ